MLGLNLKKNTFFLLICAIQLSLNAANTKQDYFKKSDSLEVFIAENPIRVLQSARIIQKLSEAQNDTIGQAIAQNLIAQTYLNIGENEKAQLVIDSAFSLISSKLHFDILLNLNKTQTNIYYVSGNTQEALSQVEKGLSLSKESKELNVIISYRQWIGDFYSQLGNSEQAIKEKQIALNLALPTNKQGQIALAYHSLGNTYWFHSQFEKANEAYKTALTIRKNLNDTVETIQTLRNIGLVNRDIGKSDESRNVLIDALDLAKAIKNKSQIADILNLLGSLSLKAGNSVEAIGYYQESYQLREQLGLLQSAAATLDNIGRAKKEMKLFNEAENHFNKSLELRKQISDKKGIASSYNEIGNLFSLQGNLTEALRFYLLSLKTRQELGNPNDIGRSLTNIGLTYRKLNSHSNALKYFSNALELTSEANDPIGRSYIYIHIGNTLKDLKQYGESIENYKKALTLRANSANEALKVPVLRNLAIALNEQGKTNEAKAYLNKALNLCKKLNDKKGIADLKNELGNIAVNDNNLTEAIDLFNEASIIYGNQNELDKKGLCLRKMGEANTKLGTFNIALPQLKEALALGNLTKNAKLTELTLNALYKHYESRGMYKEALNFYNKHITIRDSLNTINQKESILQLSVELELGKKLDEIRQIEAEIELLKTEDALKSSVIQRQKIVRNSMIVIISLLVLLILAVTYGYLLFKKANRKLAESSRELQVNIKTKDKLFSIIAHDLRSPFTALAGLTEILSTQIKSLELNEIEEFSKNINESSVKLLTLIDNLLHWARSQTGKLVLKPQPINIAEILNHAISVQEMQAKQKGIEVSINAEQNLMVDVDIDTMNTVFRNLISNAIKFTNPSGKITIKAFLENNSVIVSITDNGVGIKEDNLSRIFNQNEVVSTKGTSNESGSGLGLTLCKDFVEKNGGEISVSSKIGIGTTFTVNLPYASK